MELTKDEEYAVRDCVWCKLAKFDEDGNFTECLSKDNPTKRPLLECQLQQPDYKDCH